ncbi:MAG TPA: membrane dipeptidase [Chloroflexi bacterium]|nr:membrane dipeptidase [Chloroflexota bacterium]
MTTAPSPTIPIFDGHNDTLTELAPLKPGGREFLTRSDTGHLDLPRARAGGFSGGIFAICVPHTQASFANLAQELVVTDAGYEIPPRPPCDPNQARQFTTAAMATLFRLVTEAAGQIEVVRSAADLTRCLDQDILAVVLHLEGAEPIDPALDALYVFYEAGLRSLGITWSRPNLFGHGVPFKFPSSPDTGPGLTDAGRALVRACNQIGIMIDLAHLNERGFWDVAQLSDAPLVVTHTAVHQLCPSARNLTDRQLDAVGETDGIVGVTFYVGDLRPDGRGDADASLALIVEHVDYIAHRIGVEHVAFGSDFDGAPIPAELKDVTGLPRLVQALRERGYDDEALHKIAHQNWTRVLRQTWR